MDNKYLLSTLVKAKQILDLIDKNKFVTLKQVEDELNLKKSTAFRLLYSLNDLGFLSKSDNKYFLKNQFVDTKNIQNLNWTVVPLLKPLVDKFKLSAYIGIIFDEKIVISQVVPTAEHWNDYDRLGESMPLNTTAMGKCALAFSSEEKQNELFSTKNFISKTKNTLTDQFSIKQSLKVIREQGYALDDQEKELKFRCIATPLCKDNELVAVMGLSGTLDELRRCDIKKLAKEMNKKGKEIEMTLLN